MNTPHTIAAKLSQNIESVVPFLRAMAKNSYDLANTPNRQQAIMDALPDFGVSAAEALTVYGTIYGALASLNKADGLTAPNLEIFQPQPDGTVLYVPRAEPDPEP
jgi:hypothetical protein